MKGIRSSMIWGLCVSMLCVTASLRAAGEGGSEGGSDAGLAQEAADVFWNGKRHYDQGHFDRALTEFQRAYDLTQDPDLLYNLAQTYRRLGDCERARESYRDFLRALPPAPLAARAEQQLARLESSCPSVSAEATTPGAPIRAESPPSAPAAAQPAETSASRAPVSSVPVSSAPVSSAPRREPLPLARSGRIWFVSSVIVLTTGLAAAGTAAGLEFWNLPRYRQWRERDQALKSGPRPGETSTTWLTRQNQNDRLSESIDRVDRAALLLGVSGVTLLGASALLYRITPRNTSRLSGLHASGVLLPPSKDGFPPSGLTVSGSF